MAFLSQLAARCYHVGARSRDKAIPHCSNRGHTPHRRLLTDRTSGASFAIMLNHLARGKAEVRQVQAEGLREWAKAFELPLIAIGDYNFDYVFATEKGNSVFDLFMADDVFEWVVPH